MSCKSKVKVDFAEVSSLSIPTREKLATQADARPGATSIRAHMTSLRFATVLTVASLLHALAAAESTCYGKVNNGRIENAVSLPREGANFVRMAQGPVSAGRVYVHSLVQDILMDAWAALAADRPNIRWVYGETGLPNGGRFRPSNPSKRTVSGPLRAGR